jgi:PAS domain S-box-containing protein
MVIYIPGAIVETDADLRITYVNQEGVKMFNYSEEDVAAGLNGMDLIHTDDRENALKRVSKG